MNPGIIIALLVVPAAAIIAFLWYRRSIADLQPGEPTPISGTRLTAEALHRLPSPPWRVIYEISDALGEVDHVVIGPPGVIAITTALADRPSRTALISERGEPMLVSEAAIARGPLDELLRAVDASCDVSARVFWGTPEPNRPAGEDIVHGSVFVEGQRIGDWLTAAPAMPLEPSRIDEIWRTVITGIGRPDPLA